MNFGLKVEKSIKTYKQKPFPDWKSAFFNKTNDASTVINCECVPVQ